MKDQAALLQEFVSCFEKLGDEMSASRDLDPIAWEFARGETDDLGRKQWRPARITTERSYLDPIYAKLPSRFPALFEHLVLSYRWADVDLNTYTLLANPLGHDLSRLFGRLSDDPYLWEALIPAGYIRFAKGPDLDYDPVCFDIRSQRKNGDCRVVKIDHEEILCNSRVKVVAELAPGFEELVRQTIEFANSGRLRL
jgi:hypothetical protein